MKRSLAISVLAGAGVAVAACAPQQTSSFEDGLWMFFAGHPKPVVYKQPPPPVFCYPTLAEPMCYAEVLPGEPLIADPEPWARQAPTADVTSP